MTELVKWVSFTDSHARWLFDESFFASGWSCTFGDQCPGTEPDDNGARGCCAHGAHMADEQDRQLTITAASRLTEQQWENFGLVATDDDLFDLIDGSHVTRRIDDACIFLNSRSFDGGHGCALHIGAMAADERPMDWKPDVCWQVPLRLEQHVEDAGTTVVTLRRWLRTDWGEGGDDFAHWCTERLDAASEARPPVARHQFDEIAALVGDAPAEWLLQYVESLRTESVQGAGEPQQDF